MPDMDIDIIFEDADIAVVDKPPDDIVYAG
jgi:23S rRNA-/tRNA-specific pseudouridylate synthase